MAPKRDIAHHLADMLQATGEIEQLIAGKTLGQYKRHFARAARWNAASRSCLRQRGEYWPRTPTGTLKCSGSP